MQIEKTGSGPVKKAAEGIKNAFKSVDTVALPHPGSITRKSEEHQVSLRRKRIILFNTF